MKGKHFTTSLLLTAFGATKNKQQQTIDKLQERKATHEFLLRRRPAAPSCNTPMYRSVTACIH